MEHEAKPRPRPRALPWRRLWRYLNYKTSLLCNPLPGIYMLNETGMRILNQCRTSAQRCNVIKLQTMFNKINRALPPYEIVDCGTDLPAAFLPLPPARTFPFDNLALPTVQVLMQEFKYIANARTDVMLLLVGNLRHKLALLSLLHSQPVQSEAAEEEAMGRMELKYGARLEEHASRDDAVLRTCASLLLAARGNREDVDDTPPSLFLDSIELSFGEGVATTQQEGYGFSKPYLLILPEVGALVIHGGNATGNSFSVQRAIQGGVWLSVRERFGCPERFRVWLHTSQCVITGNGGNNNNMTIEFPLSQCIVNPHFQSQAGEDSLLDLPPHFNLLVRFTDFPEEAEEDEEEEEPAMTTTLEQRPTSTMDELFARQLQLANGVMDEDELYAWSLQFEQEAEATARNNNEQFPLGASLPISIFSTTTSSSSPPLQCLVCQYSFEPGEEMRTLPCFHHFHPNCCDAWFLIKPNCPLCQTPISSSNDAYDN